MTGIENTKMLEKSLLLLNIYIVSAYTGGLRGGFTGENLARHPGASYDKNARFPQARRLLDMHNYHQLTISFPDLEMYAALSLRSRNPQDNLTI